MTLLALRDDDRPVAGLLTSVTDGYDRVSMHGVRHEFVVAQSAAAGVPLRVVRLPQMCGNAEYEAAMGAAMSAARAEGLATVAFGDLFLADIRAYREAQLARVGMAPLFPLWGADTAAFARSVLTRGLRAVIVCVDGEQLDPAFCGRDYDAALLEDLPGGVDPAGENGEFHTFVWDGPCFAAPIRVRRGEQVTRDKRFRYQDLLPLRG